MKKILLSLLVAFAAIATSCNKETLPDGGETNGVLTLTIKGEEAQNTRYAGGSNTLEGLVTNFTVFVFNSGSGALEKQASFPVTGTAYEKRVEGLTTNSVKRVVVFVNVPDDADFSGVTNYSNLNTTPITLASQNTPLVDSKGFFMTGEEDGIVLVKGSDNDQTIEVKRRVSKVVLKSLKVTPEAPAVLSDFTLTGVSVQLARVDATPFGALKNPTDAQIPTAYTGGIAGLSGATPEITLTADFLKETLSLPAGYVAGSEILSGADGADERYFYVLPNDNTHGLGTKLTLAGTYSTATTYFPFVINGPAAGGQTGTDGTYITSNKIYAISVLLKKINVGSEDPNVIPEDVVMDVTIVPQDWDGTLNQSVEW